MLIFIRIRRVSVTFSDRKVSISPFEISVSSGATLRYWNVNKLFLLLLAPPSFAEDFSNSGWFRVSAGGFECSPGRLLSRKIITLVTAMAPHYSTLAWKIPWAEKPGRLQPMGSRRVGHDWSDLAAAAAATAKCLLQSNRLPFPPTNFFDLSCQQGVL